MKRFTFFIAATGFFLVSTGYSMNKEILNGSFEFQPSFNEAHLTFYLKSCEEIYRTLQGTANYTKASFFGGDGKDPYIHLKTWAPLLINESVTSFEVEEIFIPENITVCFLKNHPNLEELELNTWDRTTVKVSFRGYKAFASEKRNHPVDGPDKFGIEAPLPQSKDLLSSKLLSNIMNLKKLKTLILGHKEVRFNLPDIDFGSFFESFQVLEVLKLNNWNNKAKDFHSIAKLDKMRVLKIKRCCIDPEIFPVANLQRLHLVDCEGNLEKCVAQVKGAPLVELKLGGSPSQPQKLINLDGMFETSLRALHLKNFLLTDNLKYLKKFKKLKILKLDLYVEEMQTAKQLLNTIQSLSQLKVLRLRLKSKDTNLIFPNETLISMLKGLKNHLRLELFISNMPKEEVLLLREWKKYLEAKKIYDSKILKWNGDVKPKYKYKQRPLLVEWANAKMRVKKQLTYDVYCFDDDKTQDTMPCPINDPKLHKDETSYSRELAEKFYPGDEYPVITYPTIENLDVPPCPSPSEELLDEMW